LLKQRKAKRSLHRQIEMLREQLHRQKDITNGDALKLSAELDLLILEAMKKSKAEV
jgi:hypothetical protein